MGRPVATPESTGIDQLEQHCRNAAARILEASYALDDDPMVRVVEKGLQQAEGIADFRDRLAALVKLADELPVIPRNVVGHLPAGLFERWREACNG